MADANIGSVSVSVTPDATGFWRDFEARTRGQATEAGRHAGADWRRGFDLATRDQVVRVRADVDTTRARAELNSLGKTNTGGLVANLAAIAPALVPIAGAAAVAGAALGAFGVTGALAVKGVKDAMKAGTPVGVQWAGALGSAKTQLDRLSATAAAGTLSGVQQAVVKSNRSLPEFNAQIAQTSRVLGDVTQHLVGGLIGGVGNFSPLIQQIGGDADRAAAAFERWATGPGGASFAKTLGEDLATVAPLLSNLGDLATNVLHGLNDAGLPLVKTFTQITGILAKLDPSTITALAEAYTIYRATVAVTAGINAATGANLRLAESEAAVGAGARAGAAGALSTRGRLAAGASRAGGAAIAGYLGLQFADQATLSSRTSQSEPGFLASNYVGYLKQVFSGGGINGDAIARNRAEQNDQAVLMRGFRDATRNSIAGNPFANENFGGRLNLAYDGQGRYSGYGATTGHGSIAPATAAAAANARGAAGALTGALAPGAGAALAAGAAAAALSVKKLTNAEVENAQASKTFDVVANRVTSSFKLVDQNAARVDFSSAAQGYTSLAGSLQKSVDVQAKWLDQGGKTIGTIEGQKIGEKTLKSALSQTNGDYVKAVGLITGRIDALGRSKQAVADAQDREQHLSEAVSEASKKYNLSAEQVSMYAQVVGISAEKVADGSISAERFTKAVGAVASVVAQGNTALTSFVSAAATFAQGTDTAASRATLLGAAMVALNGDTLTYQSTMASTAVANQKFVTDFDNAGKKVLNLKTGTLDFHNAAAAPLLQDLQSLQAAASAAAQATYQHEVSLKGQKAAAKDAADVFRNDTYGALIKEHEALGLTIPQAKKLADTYFHWPKNAKTQIEQLGGGKVQATLAGILQDLDVMSGGHHADLYLTGDSEVISRLNNVRGAIERVQGGHVVGVTFNPGANQNTATRYGGIYNAYAFGGIEDHSPQIAQAGTAGRARVWAEPETGGEAYIPLANDARRGRARAITMETARRLGGVARFESGGFTGVQTAAQQAADKAAAKASSSSKATAGMTAAESRAVIAAGSALIITSARLSASYSDVHSAASALRSAAVAAHASSADLKSISSTQKSLLSDATRRDSIRARLGSAPTAPTAYERLANARSTYSQDYGNYKSSVLGGFDITQAGTAMATTSSTSPLNNVSVSKTTGSSIGFGSILAAKGQAAKDAARFVVIMQKLAKEGLDRADLDQLAAAGPSALPTAEALAKATPAQIRKLTSLQTSIGKSATSLAGTLATRFDAAGVSAALGIVHGLQSQDAAITKAMDRLANTMVGRIKHKLGIHSPSTVFRREIGHNVVDSTVLGLDERTPKLRAAATRVGSAMIPTVDMGSASGGSGGAPIQLTVNPQPYQSEMEIGMHAANEVMWALAR